MPMSDEELAKEAAYWDGRKNEPNLWNNLKKEGWVDAPEALPSAKQVAPRGEMAVKRLLDADLCPCKSGKTFAECCRGELKEGMTPENTLHLLFEERDPTDTREEPLIFYAVQTNKMDGKVPPEAIVEAIAKRLHSPHVARALDRLTWKTRNSKGLSMVMTPPIVQEPGIAVVPNMEHAKKLAERIEIITDPNAPVKR